MSQRLNGRPWISSLLQADENISHAGVGKNGRGSAWAGGGTAQHPPASAIPCSETCLHRNLFSGFLYHVGSLFPLVLVSGKSSARILLDFFFSPSQSFASAIPFCLVAHYFALYDQRLGSPVVCVSVVTWFFQSSEMVICLNVTT